MQKITRKKIIAFGAIIITAFIFFGIIRSCNRGSKDKFEFDVVTTGKVEKTISVTGMLELSNSRTILSRSTGVMKKIYVDFNQHVRKGQVLAEIDATDVDQMLRKLSAQLENNKLELTIAKEDLETKRSMFKDNLISDKGLERAEYNYKTVLLKQKQFLVDYENTRMQKNNTRVTSPVDGLVLSITAKENVPVILNSPLFIIAPNMDKMTLTISIDESDIGLIKKDQNVYFTVSAFPEKTFHGKINQVRINPVMRGGLVTYDSVVTCENEDSLLKPGMTATATIEINKKENVIRIPNQALIVNPLEGKAQPEKNTVWRKSDRRGSAMPVEKVKVDVGLRGDTYTEIKKGLKKGDSILLKYVRGSSSTGK